MALTAPTPPTAPAPPVVPGARQSSSQDGNAGQEAGNGASAAAEMGRGFGVHITINPPGQADSGKGGGQENTVVQTVPSGQQAGAEQGKAAEKPASAKDTLVAEPMIGSIPFAITLLKVDASADANALAKEIKEKVDPRRWVCVEASYVETAVKDNVILLVLDGDNARGAEIIAAFNNN